MVQASFNDCSGQPGGFEPYLRTYLRPLVSFNISNLE